MALKDSAVAYKDTTSFDVGDFIEVNAQGNTIRGTALTRLGGLGTSAIFQMQLPDGQELQYNINYVDVELLFKAEIARIYLG